MPQIEPSILKLDELTIAFAGNRPAVDGVSLSLSAGDRLGLLGLSGSGKSLTALALLGLLPPTAQVTAGKAIYTRADGTTVDLLQLDEAGWRKLRGREISLVFQEPLTALNPVQRVGKQLIEAVRMLCTELKTAAAREAHLSDWLRRVELPNEQDRLLRSYPHELSGGQRQRLLLALALLGGPRLLIADEPTTALDTITESGILNLLEKLRRELGMTLIFITHDLHVMRRITDRTAVLAAGKVVHRGRTEEVLSLPQSKLFATGTSTSDQRLVKSIASRFPLPGRGAGGEVTIQNLSISYHSRKTWPWSKPQYQNAVRDVSFTVAAGEWVAIAGPSGCGKTTVARCLAGLLSPAAGTISGLEEGRTQLIFQDPFSSLNPTHTARTILREVLRLHPETDLTVKGLLASVGLPADEFSERRPSALSGGQRQRVAIARALAANPRLLIADEAVSALDVPLRAEILDLLDVIRRKEGVGLLFITHDLRLVRERADRVLIMDDGRIVEEGTAGDVMDNPQSGMAKALRAAL